ncbi:hypothetical protein [uncultured Thiodictyon sp.]|uniref:hypothetical protein n=1 Tax=uncultured Thiodictyon sp. TaxID=1846217 RepID=UPI0025F23AC2|nr:hypothetical protein [uncultured Thiodictyon sp.]
MATHVKHVLVDALGEETQGARRATEVSSPSEGEAKGKAEGLERLLARRFGPWPPWAEERIATAPIARLDAWSTACSMPRA